MKSVMTALAVALLAGAVTPALAQPRGERAERGEARDRPQREHTYRGWSAERRDGVGGPPRAREAPRAPAAPQAAEPRRGLAQGAIEEAHRRRAEQLQGGGRDDGRRGERRDRDGRRDWGRDDGDRRDWGRRDGDRRDGDRRDGDRRDWDRRDGDRRDWDRRGDRDRRDWDRRGDHRRWERGRYPSVYFSSHRYRHAWRPPVGFYVRSWGYGDVLPRGWFGRSYWLLDPWQFDLPLPPPGFAWVRAGDDALLVDEYNGRIVQVVRDIFW